MLPIKEVGRYGYLKFALVAFGNPLTFVIYEFFVFFMDLSMSLLPLFFVFAIPAHYAWFKFELSIIQKYKKINVPAFLSANLSTNFCWIGFLGFISNFFASIFRAELGGILIPVFLIFSMIELVGAVKGKFGNEPSEYQPSERQKITLRTWDRSTYLKIIMVAIGNPIIFWMYANFFLRRFSGNSWFYPFYNTADGYRLNLFFFVIFALIFQIGWLSLEIFALSLIKNLNRNVFLSANLSRNFCLVAALGILNVCVWGIVGVDLTSYGLVYHYLGPLLSLAFIALTGFEISKVLTGKFDIK